MFDLLVVFGVALLFIQIIRILLSDCDLHLQWYCKFGETPASLKGKVVWITGASSGIGEALAYKLSSVGCKLILSARREDRLKQVKDHCLKQNPGIGTGDIFILPLDLLDFGSHANAVEVVLKYFKKIDVLVNNAGRSQRALWEKTSLEVDKAMLNVNVLGLLSLTKCILPQMIKQNYGRIVITSSLAGKLGAPGLGSYSGSKHALHTLGVEMKPTEKRMTAERCAYLMSVAMANDLDEVWLSGNPELFFLYLYQYFPTITRRLGRRIGAKRVKKLQSGMTNLH
ncbi:dehydrogenase/reductase SDR family member 7-like isoform X3 [Mytilus galloprovincialis]|uniref:dehydrogenase/reductase SDR family member 7-like isoform X3 n=1 Tax=Mytilus galloprovincialis TaxID=29158 RepID=UPI003F7BFBFD